MGVPIEVLKRCSLFADFTDTGLTIFAGVARRREVPAGLSVFLAGTTGDGLLIVESGEVEVALEDGRVLLTLGPGAHFGELALLRPSTRAVSARATSPTRLAEIRRADFHTLLKSKPQACFKLMLVILGVVAERLDAVRHELIALA